MARDSDGYRLWILSVGIGYWVLRGESYRIGWMFRSNGNLINGLCDAKPLLAGFRILTSPVYVGNKILDKLFWTRKGKISL